MIWRLALLFGLAVCIGTTSDAQARKLQQDEIVELLEGNTAEGRWNGTAYRQYFDPDGNTTFAPEGGQPSRGEWRVQGEEYQSVWPGDSDWESWFVMEYLGDHYWVSRSTPPTPFAVLDGQQLVE